MTWLTPGGVVAALVVGATVTAGLGWRGLVLLLAFFATSSVVTRRASRDARGRSARQVVANGAVAAAAALLGWWTAAAGALAAATADTWATEIGRRSPRPPRLITSGAVVPAGTSGAITALGTAAALAGALSLAALAAWLTHRSTGWAGAVAAAGAAGMAADSLLGATVQIRYRCPRCGAEFERRDARCHELPRPAGGIRWVDNDAVNLLGTALGAAFAAWLAR